MQGIIKYEHSWQKIYIMCLHARCIFLSHCEGISKISLEGVQSVTLEQVKDEPYMLTSFGSQIIFSNQNRASLCTINTNGEVEVFAGSKERKVVWMGKYRIAGFDKRWASARSLKA